MLGLSQISMSTRRPVSALLIAPKTMARLRMLSWPTVSGSEPARTAATKSPMTPKCPPMRSSSASAGGSTGVDRVEEALALAGSESFDADRVGAVPDERAFRADETPRRIPTSVGSPGAHQLPR